MSVKLIIDTAKTVVLGSAFERLAVNDLAKKLRVKPPAIYYHLVNKRHLLSLLSEQIMREVELPDPVLHWKERLRLLILAMRDTFVAYPGLGRYMACHQGDKATALWMEKHIRVLLDGGLDSKHSAEALITLQCYINPLNMLEDPEVGQPSLSCTKSFCRYIEEDPTSFQGLGQTLESMRVVSYGEMYEIGLPSIIEGIEARYFPQAKEGLHNQ